MWQCRRCGYEHSYKVNYCTQCGLRMKKTRSSKVIMLIIVGLLSTTMFVTGMAVVVQGAKQQLEVFLGELPSESISIANKKNERMIMPSIAFQNIALRRILEDIFGKGIDDITWEDIDTIGYIGIYKEGEDEIFAYRAKDDGDEEITIYYNEPPFMNQMAITDELGLFYGLESLDVSEVAGIDVKTLENLSDLQVLKIGECQNVTQLEDLAAFYQLIELEIGNKALTSLEGIEHFYDLRNLTLKGLAINDFAPLVNYEGLVNLSIQNPTQPIDLKEIGAIENLYTLTLTGKDITSLKGIERLGTLETLILKDTAITSIAPLEKLPYLEDITLENNKQIQDLSILEKSVDLRYLTVKACGQHKLPFVPTLNYLEISGVDDLSGIGELTALQSLIIEDSTMENIGEMKNLYEVSYVKLGCKESGGGIGEDMSFLFQMPNLKTLYLEGGPIRLENKVVIEESKLHNLYLERCKFVYNWEQKSDGIIQYMDYETYTTDKLLEAIGQNEDLVEVGLNEMAIEHITFVEKLESLQYLELISNSISNLEALRNHPSLQTIDLSNNPLTDLEPLMTIPELQNVIISGSGLEGNTQLKELATQCNVLW